MSETIDRAVCVSCGQLAAVCCDSSFSEHVDPIDGRVTVEHTDPLCRRCCSCPGAMRERAAQLQAQADVPRQLLAALQVILRTPYLVRLLDEADPKALAQAQAAVRLATGVCGAQGGYGVTCDRPEGHSGPHGDMHETWGGAQEAHCPVCGGYLGDYGTCVTVGCGGAPDDGRDNGAPFVDGRDTGDRGPDPEPAGDVCEHGYAAGSCRACDPDGGQ